MKFAQKFDNMVIHARNHKRKESNEFNNLLAALLLKMNIFRLFKQKKTKMPARLQNDLLLIQFYYGLRLRLYRWPLARLMLNVELIMVRNLASLTMFFMA